MKKIKMRIFYILKKSQENIQSYQYIIVLLREKQKLNGCYRRLTETEKTVMRKKFIRKINSKI